MHNSKKPIAMQTLLLILSMTAAMADTATHSQHNSPESKSPLGRILKSSQKKSAQDKPSC